MGLVCNIDSPCISEWVGIFHVPGCGPRNRFAKVAGNHFERHVLLPMNRPFITFPSLVIIPENNRECAPSTEDTMKLLPLTFPSRYR